MAVETTTEGGGAERALIPIVTGASAAPA
jgi:hypothetical protein